MCSKPLWPMYAAWTRPRVFLHLSDAAEQGGRLREAMAYQRGAEFFLDPWSEARLAAYRRFRALFDAGFGDLGWTRHSVRYGDAALPAYHLPAVGPARGTVLVHGGFDSLIEEFVGIWVRIAQAGFDVVAFEGPGQGGARLLGGLAFDHDWEKPVAAVLDHFDLERAGLVGISMGGWWALRAAAVEPRVTAVVSWSPVYDWLARLPWVAQVLVRFMVRFRTLMNLSIRVRMRLFPVIAHAVRHGMFIACGREPMDAVDWMLGMNADALHSEAVRQPVLLMVGEDDAFQPPALADAQQAALTASASVTRRDFTAAEHASAHCQMGNLELATFVLTAWLTQYAGPAQQR